MWCNQNRITFYLLKNAGNNTTLLQLYPFNIHFFRTTWVSRHQKGKSFWILLEQELIRWQWSQQVSTNLDFNEAREDGVAVASAGPYANHVQLAPDK